MKIRMGFVSNSSSSSYLVPLNAFDTVFDLAKKIIDIRDEDWKETCESPEFGTMKNLQRAKKKGISQDTPVQFITCNYATWIKKTDKGFIVETCNNHFEISQMMDEYGAKYIEDHRELGLEEYKPESSSNFFNERFYFLEIEKFGHKKYIKDPGGETSELCNKKNKNGFKCGNSILVLDDETEICTKCEGLGELE